MIATIMSRRVEEAVTRRQLGLFIDFIDGLFDTAAEIQPSYAELIAMYRSFASR
jgi:hypothetical protein